MMDSAEDMEEALTNPEGHLDSESDGANDLDQSLAAMATTKMENKMVV
jgi:hypothetical protein